MMASITRIVILFPLFTIHHAVFLERTNGHGKSRLMGKRRRREAGLEPATSLLKRHGPFRLTTAGHTAGITQYAKNLAFNSRDIVVYIMPDSSAARPNVNDRLSVKP